MWYPIPCSAPFFSQPSQFAFFLKTSMADIHKIPRIAKGAVSAYLCKLPASDIGQVTCSTNHSNYMKPVIPPERLRGTDPGSHANSNNDICSHKSHDIRGHNGCVVVVPGSRTQGSSGMRHGYSLVSSLTLVVSSLISDCGNVIPPASSSVQFSTRQADNALM